MASQPPPRVSIVILTYNQLDYTRKCVASVVRHTRQPYELIFVDNASSDGTLEYLRTIPNARLIANSENLGFAGGNNQGLAIAEGDYVVLLNNDAIVTPDWLTRLLAPFERDSRVGFAGPRSNYVAGDQLLADVAYRDLEDLDGFAEQRAIAHAGQGKLTAFIVGFCLVLRRTVVERIGGLDTRFGNGNYEDNDYCLRAVRAGWLGWIADDVFVHHYGHRTFIGAGIDWSASMQQNGHLFAAKWGLEFSSQGPDFSGLGPVLSAPPNPQRDCFALPEHVTFTRITPGLAAYHRGIQALQQGGLEQAIHELQAAVAERADVADFHNALAAAYSEGGRYDLALGALRRALELAPHDAAIRANYDELRQYGALLAAVPRHARRILVAAGDADCDGLTQALAAQTGEREIFVDADEVLASLPARSLDCIVYGDRLAREADPVGVLRRHHVWLKPDGQVVCRIANGQRLALLRGLLTGDFQTADGPLVDPRDVQAFTYATFTKLLLDAGYAPHIAVATASPEAASLLDAAQPLIGALRLDQHRTRQYLATSEYVFRGAPLAAIDGTDAQPITFVACVNNEEQLHSNLLQSPCFAGRHPHQLVLVRGAASAAEGLNYGIDQAEHEVVVLLHQDVYLPAEWPARFMAQSQLAHARFGDLGMLAVFGTRLEEGCKREYGHVVDRHSVLARGPLPARVDTVDELLMAVPRDTPLRFDGALGWHLYGADLALQARQRALAVVAVDALCFHNSRGSYQLPTDYWKSAEVFVEKWRSQLPIVTPCADFGVTVTPGAAAA